MEMQVFGSMFDSNSQTDWVVNKLQSYGIEAYRKCNNVVEYITTPNRNETLKYLFAWWNGMINEWWFRFDMLWYVNHRNFFPGACMEAMMFGKERPNIFAPNEEMKHMYRERHMRRHKQL